MQSGNTSEAGEGSGGPDKSFLFLLTISSTLESDRPEIGLSKLAKAVLFRPFRCALDVP